jgi:hypothetical protein
VRIFLETITARKAYVCTTVSWAFTFEHTPACKNNILNVVNKATIECGGCSIVQIFLPISSQLTSAMEKSVNASVVVTLRDALDRNS